MTVDVDPVQLVVLHHVLRFGPATIDVLFREVESTKPVPRETFDAAIAALVAGEVADYRFRVEDGTTLLALTALGMKLRGKLPATSQSRLAIYV